MPGFNLPSPIRESGVNPDALRANEINRRATVAQAPIKFGDMLNQGIAAGQAVQGLQENQEKAAKAEAFQRILDAGVPAMQEFQASLPAESVAKRVDVNLFKDKPDVWWKMAVESKEAEKTRIAAETVKTETAKVIDAGGSYEETAKGLVKAGALPAKDYISALKPQRAAIRESDLPPEMKDALEEGMKRIEAVEKETGSILPKSTRQAILRSYGIPASLFGNKFVDAVVKTGTTGLDEDTKEFKEASDANAKTNIAIKKDEVIDKRTQRTIDEVQDFGKEYKDVLKVKVGLEQVDRALIDAGIPDGIKAKDADIPGIGFATRYWRDWLNSDEAVTIRLAVRSLMLGVRKENAGSAVTPSEAENLNKTFGLDAKSTGKAFLAGMRNFLEKNRASLKVAGLGLSKGARDILIKDGILPKDDEPAEPAEPPAAPKTGTVWQNGYEYDAVTHKPTGRQK